MTNRQTTPAQPPDETPASDQPRIDAPQDPAQSPSTREDDIAGSEGGGGNIGRGGYREAEGPDPERRGDAP